MKPKAKKKKLKATMWAVVVDGKMVAVKRLRATAKIETMRKKKKGQIAYITKVRVEEV